MPAPSSPAIIALVSMVSLFFNEDYRPGVVGTALWFAVGLLYFAVGGRNRLVFSPEEEFAVNMREKHGRSAHSAGTASGAGTAGPTTPTSTG